jgi:hypothetical protein
MLHQGGLGRSSAGSADAPSGVLPSDLRNAAGRFSRCASPVVVGLLAAALRLSSFRYGGAAARWWDREREPGRSRRSARASAVESALGFDSRLPAGGERRRIRGCPDTGGIDEDGRERLVFIEGEVPVAPYPDWSQSDNALASIARLLRGLHDAARGFDPQGLTWNDRLADPAGGTLVCHNDVELSNVVFRDGIAVALLDFEFAAPGGPVYDVAQLARLCVPMEDDFDQDRIGWRRADRPARLRLVADAYGLDRDGRAELLTAMSDALARIEAAARRSIDAGDPNTVTRMNRTGGIEKYDRRRRWWSDHHDQFAAALL